MTPGVPRLGESVDEQDQRTGSLLDTVDPRPPGVDDLVSHGQRLWEEDQHDKRSGSASSAPSTAVGAAGPAPGTCEEHPGPTIEWSFGP